MLRPYVLAVLESIRVCPPGGQALCFRRRSSVEEQPIRNRQAEGSNPPAGSIPGAPRSCFESLSMSGSSVRSS